MISIIGGVRAVVVILGDYWTKALLGDFTTCFLSIVISDLTKALSCDSCW